MKAFNTFKFNKNNNTSFKFFSSTTKYFKKKLTVEKLREVISSKSSSLGKNYKRNIIISSIALLGGGALIAHYITNQNSKGTLIYKTILQKVKHDKQVKELLGEPIKAGYNVNITRNVSVFLQCTEFNVTGPKGTATVSGCCECLPRELPTVQILKLTLDGEKKDPIYLVKKKTKEALELETK
eukprot:TRINITY_DN860_c0_g1_i1.p1 TRINITY_DN860_c0_g1~~TRINITY_DN860_c0_g1_i1.p1  ORF type:complete len:183 (-),score=45.05 TRINITY_DN860_c0_g1_i1:21-569(-)